MSATVPVPSYVSLANLRGRIAEWLHIPSEDLDAIDFILACYVSNRMPGDPVWGLLVDASGGGKTELLRAFRKRPDAEFLSKLTEKTLKSGYRDPKHPERDPSLLPKLNGKVLIIKDLSPLLTMRRESRNIIIGDLRDAYDQFSDDGYGNIGKVSYEARFSLLAASTLALERFSAVDQELGERFIKFRARGNENRKKVRRAIGNVGRDQSLRTELEKAVGEFLDGLPAELPQAIPEALQEPLAVLADFTATSRSAVAKDRNHELSYLPRPEVGTRLGKELGKLLLALAYVRGKPEPDADDFQTVCRVAEDCLPPNRLLILQGRADALPPTTARHAKKDLQVLDILNGDSGLSDHWKEALADVPHLLR